VIPSAELTSGYMRECVLMGLLPRRDFARVATAGAVPTATPPPLVPTGVHGARIVAVVSAHRAEARWSAPAPPTTGCDHGWWPPGVRSGVNDEVPRGVEANRPVCVLGCTCVRATPPAGR
jgi:hypothetical protein